MEILRGDGRWHSLIVCFMTVVCLNMRGWSADTPTRPVLRPEQVLLEAPLVEQLQRNLEALSAPFLRYGKGGIRLGHVSFGELEAADPFGNRLYEVERSFDLISALAFKHPLGNGVGIGICGNYLQRRWKDITSPALVADIGLYYQTPISGLVLTALDETASSVNQLRSPRGILPRTGRFGVAWRQAERLHWTIDWHNPYRAQPFLSSGVQWNPRPWLVCRGSVGQTGDYQVTLGIQIGRVLNRAGSPTTPAISEEAQTAQARLFSQGLLSL